METFTSRRPGLKGFVFHESGVAWVGGKRLEVRPQRNGLFYFYYKKKFICINGLLNENKETGYDRRECL
ncbi:MAG: hypothetical protein ACRCZ2_08720 [Fusobacteriaceae bacterium]